MDISDDIFDIILSFLNVTERFRLRAVNKRWCYLVEQNLRRTSTSFSTLNRFSLFYKNNQCSDPKHSIDSMMNVDICERFGLLLGVLQYLDRLSALYLHNFTLHSGQIHKLADLPFCGTTLKHLSLTSCDIRLIKRREWSYLFNRLNNLVHLTLYLNQGLTNDLLRMIKRSCTNLQEISYDITGLGKIAESPIPCNLKKIHIHTRELLPCFLSIFNLHTKTLTHLKLSCCTFGVDPLAFMIADLPSLRSFEFALVERYDESMDVGGILAKLDHLQNLTILSHPDHSDTKNIDLLLTRLIAKRKDQLKCLKIGQYSISASVLEDIFRKCKYLEEFHYFHEEKCGYFYDRTGYIFNTHFNQKTAQHILLNQSLNTLAIGYSLIKDDQLANVIKLCPKLTTLLINNCENVGPLSLSAFIELATSHPEKKFKLIIERASKQLITSAHGSNPSDIPGNLSCYGLVFLESDIDILQE